MHLVIIGGSDAGISAALRARELDPGADVTVVVADAYPNFSICGIPYYVSGEVAHWQNLAHRTIADLEATGMSLRLDTTARRIDVARPQAPVTTPDGAEICSAYDKLDRRHRRGPGPAPIAGLDGPSPRPRRRRPPAALDGRHVRPDAHPGGSQPGQRGHRRRRLHRPGDGRRPHGARTPVTQMEQLPEVLPTVDPQLGSLVHDQLATRGVEVLTGTTVRQITALAPASRGRLRGRGRSTEARPCHGWPTWSWSSSASGPTPRSPPSAGAALGVRGAIAVDRAMRTGLPDVFAAGDCVVTHHRLLGETYLPLGTTAHKQGRVAGENALGGNREFAGSLGTQVVKIFDQAAARTGLRDHEAAAAGYDPVTVQSEADDHKAYYPGSHRITMRFTGDRATGRLLGVQLFGHRHAEIAKRVDIAATAIFHDMTVDGLSDLDLSYTPPLGSPWDAIQMGAQAWLRANQPPLTTLTLSRGNHASQRRTASPHHSSCARRDLRCMRCRDHRPRPRGVRQYHHACHEHRGDGHPQRRAGHPHRGGFDLRRAVLRPGLRQIPSAAPGGHGELLRRGQQRGHRRDQRQAGRISAPPTCP